MVIAVSLFGTTDPGLEVRTTAGLSISPEAAWIGITNTEVSLLPRDFVLCASRRIVNGNILTWIGMYRRAYSIGANREGNFYGAGIWLQGMAAKGKLVLELLPQLCGEIERLAMQGESFVRKLVEIKNDIQWSAAKPAADRLNDSLRPCPPNSGLIAGDLPTLYLDVSTADGDEVSLGWILDWAQDGSAFTSYSRVMLASYPEAFLLPRSAAKSRIFTPEALRRTEAGSRAGILDQLVSVESDLLREREAVKKANAEIKALQQHLRTVHAPYRAIIPIVRESSERLKSASALLAQAEDALVHGDDSQASLRDSISAAVALPIPIEVQRQAPPVSVQQQRAPVGPVGESALPQPVARAETPLQNVELYRDQTKRTRHGSSDSPAVPWYRSGSGMVVLAGISVVLVTVVSIGLLMLYRYYIRA